MGNYGVCHLMVKLMVLDKELDPPFVRWTWSFLTTGFVASWVGNDYAQWECYTCYGMSCGLGAIFWARWDRWSAAWFLSTHPCSSPSGQADNFSSPGLATTTPAAAAQMQWLQNITKTYKKYIHCKIHSKALAWLNRQMVIPQVKWATLSNAFDKMDLDGNHRVSREELGPPSWGRLVSARRRLPRWIELGWLFVL